MTTARKHHYVPKFYLEGFTREERGSLVVYDRARKQYRSQKPVNILHIRDYYALEQEDGTLNYDIEKAFSQIEGAAKAIIVKLDEGGSLTDVERLELALFTAFQFTRTPAFLATIEAADRGLAERLTDLLAPSGHTLSDVVDKNGDPIGSFIRHRDDLLRLALKLAMEMAPALSQMNMAVIERPTDRTSFVTSDSPFCLVAISPSRHVGVGVLSDNSLKLMPLSQKSCLFIQGKGGGFTRSTADREQVRSINLTVAMRCRDFLIGRDQSLVENLVAAEQLDRTEWQPPIQVSNPGSAYARRPQTRA